jgi:hypothetical protein
MFRRVLRDLAVVATAGIVAVGVAATPAAAAPAALKGGRTTVTTAPGIATTLLRNGILPVVTKPGRVGLRFDHGLRLTASFPVTGGAVDLDPLGGDVRHRGGIKFVNLRNGKALEVGNFTIDLDTAQLTGAVNRGATRVPVFDLDLSAASIQVRGGTVVVRNVGLDLTDAAAGALNSTLRTSVFAGGLRFGSAGSDIRI